MSDFDLVESVECVQFASGSGLSAGSRVVILVLPTGSTSELPQDATILVDKSVPAGKTISVRGTLAGVTLS